MVRKIGQLWSEKPLAHRHDRAISGRSERSNVFEVLTYVVGRDAMKDQGLIEDLSKAWRSSASVTRVSLHHDGVLGSAIRR